ncbi:MAG: kelch repeat protein [Phycisphaerales bacterium]|nr:kelch repeat protein [Phycisphaerales bacterium]
MGAMPAQGAPAGAAPPSATPPAESSRASEAIEQLKPGEWYEVPDSHLDAVAAPVSKFPWLSGGIGGITQCWAGGAFDSQRDRLYVGPGGGHAGYNGNEVYAFDLHDMKWHRLNDPDPVIPGTEYTEVNKAPFAMHTYDGVDYCPPPADRYVVVGGWGTPRTYAMDPDRPDRWEVFADHGTGRTGDISAVDPTTGLLWLSTPTTAGKLSQWDPLTHRWTLRRNESPEPSYYETADVDSKRHLLVACGKGKVKSWGLSPIPERVPFSFLTTTGDTDILASSSPGFCYVPSMDKFVAWAKGPDVYTLDMDAKKWTRIPPASSNKVTPGKPDQWGTFGRFRYVASKNVFVLCNAVNQNVFIYRLNADRPNVITGVEATLTRASVETHLAAGAISVRAVYANGASKDVTEQASYFSLDPAIAEVEVHGRGVVRGITGGMARIRAVYTDPTFARGFAGEVKVTVKDIVPEATLDALDMSFPKLTIVAGDTFQLESNGSYARAADHFAKRTTEDVTWSSDAPDVVSVSKSVVKALRNGGPVKLRAAYKGKLATTEVTVMDAPVIRRINFQVKDTFDRAGWNCDNGQPYTEARGFGWLNAGHLDSRDDRESAHNLFLKSFVVAKEKQFKINVPSGPYVVRVAMGDSDYGAVPFEEWTALGTEKLVYYEGQHNSVATKIVRAGDDGLVFTVNGKINYLIVTPVGTDIEKYADDDTAAGIPHQR